MKTAAKLTTLLLAVLALATASASAQTPAIPPPPPPPLPVEQPPLGSPFDGNGMWIWVLGQSSGGSPDAIAARARAAGVTTVFVKSSDADHTWSQFSPQMVAALHARGLRVCGWGYVYGRRPVGEARAARTAISRGADCFVIDAEIEYEGRYVAASTYMTKLRAYAGPDYPIGVAPWPYVDYHPAYPFSVFLGPGGAQYDLPQMYWRAIGTSVPEVYAHTYAYHSLYTRPVYPLGQTYGGVSRSDLASFRQYAAAFGARGVSWWSWQATTARLWAAFASPLAALPAGLAALPEPPALARGARGDVVVWAQQHLLPLDARVRVNGVFDGKTARAVAALQVASALPPTGTLDAATWRALLARPAAKVRWRRAGTASAAGGGRSAPPPRSATLPPLRDELHGSH